ncbi:MAG TPA: hypothetical protein VFK04_07020 [Gemmatimonadaceae bacterium]|jgi:hypothetical protein|nr:hypothetical protein [Gemmatimonadaceae bacterium]
MRRLPLIAFLLLLLSTPLAAQRDARLEIKLPSASEVTRRSPEVSAQNVLGDRRLEELLHSGFPARLHFKLELWSADGVFDALKSEAEWDVIVRYNPLERRYSAVRIVQEHAAPLGTYASSDSVQAAVARPYRPSIRLPSGNGRHYYIVMLDVEMLSVNDIDEVERWLRGELSPAVRGERSAGTALSRGAKTLVTRLLGGRSQHYEARTRVFRGRE